MAANIAIPENRPEELNEELNTYEANITAIRRNVGKHVLIHGSTIVDYYGSYREALAAGYEMYGLGNFLIREVKAKEEGTNVLRCSLKPVIGLKLAKRTKRA